MAFSCAWIVGFFILGAFDFLLLVVFSFQGNNNSNFILPYFCFGLNGKGGSLMGRSDVAWGGGVGVFVLLG